MTIRPFDVVFRPGGIRFRMSSDSSSKKNMLAVCAGKSRFSIIVPEGPSSRTSGRYFNLKY